MKAASLPAVRRDGADLLLELRVQPRAATDGRANEALVEFLAQALGVPKSSVRIERGLTGRDKRVRIRRPASPLPGALLSLLGED